MSFAKALHNKMPSSAPRRFKVQWRSVAVIALSLFLLVPLFGVIFGAFSPSEGGWAHLARTVLPIYTWNTLNLLFIVAVMTSLIGVGTAWLIAATDFPFRKAFEWMLVLPIAAPAYIIAYVYTDLLEFAGPVQTALRSLTGWQADDYWFPAVRSLPGAGLMLSLVLYPYVYLLARSAFLNHSRIRFAAARSLGASPWRAFWRVALPAARPAILGGVALCMMETAADFGVADYFGVTTFSTGIFRAWYGLGDPVSALRLAGLLLIIVGVLVLMERLSRSDSDGNEIARDSLSQPMKLASLWRWLAMLACALPILFGFVIPVLRLAWLSLGEEGVRSISNLIDYMGNSITVSVIAALVTVQFAILLVYLQRGRTRHESLRFSTISARLATLGYALPGTLLAVGLLLPMTSLDKAISRWLDHTFDLGLGLLLTGTIFTLIYAYTIRFLTVAYNTVEPAIGAIPRAMDEAARTLGAKTISIVSRVHFPGLRPALYSAALLVFIDTMRELPATLLLRPFDFETLATRVYRLASDERLAEAAPAALTLVLIGLLPVILLSTVAKKR